MKLKAKAYLRIAAEDWRDKYYYVGPFIEGLAAVKRGTFIKGKWGFVNQQGEEVFPLKYDYAGPFREGLAEVELDDKVGWVTREGKELLLTEDKHIQIKNLIELEKITEEDLINWINERAVKRN